MPGIASAADGVVVNVDNFVRAETADQFDRSLGLTGGVNAWYHFREPAPIDNQSVIRMNRDTLYSGAIVDISEGARLILPDTGDRYVSVMVVNEDHYVNRIFHEPGTHELSIEEFDTPYVLLAARTLVDASDPDDIRAANALQDLYVIEANSAQPYSHPAYDTESYKATYEPLLELGRGVPDARRTFGKKEDVDAVRHLLGTAWGWAGLPEHEAFYLNVEPNLPVGAYALNVRDVPVDAFWSVSVYNRDGFFEENELGAYSVNSITGTPNADGSVTIHLGGDPESDNHLPIADGWNYTVRLYQPRAEVLDGSWTFPTVEPVQ
ncbi:DUF1214 domain-containing protein [Pseudoruegeria sp. M32A2M]|nr:DUF1214 domain-containing protein [Pseudoruegeria sp. M32A2M]